MAGQTQEHLLDTCENLPEVIWRAANGENIPPKFTSKYHRGSDDPLQGPRWGRAGERVLPEAEPYVKLYRLSPRGRRLPVPAAQERRAWGRQRQRRQHR